MFILEGLQAILALIGIACALFFWIAFTIVVAIILIVPSMLIRSIFGRKVYILFINKIKNFLINNGFVSFKAQRKNSMGQLIIKREEDGKV